MSFELVAIVILLFQATLSFAQCALNAADECVDANYVTDGTTTLCTIGATYDNSHTLPLLCMSGSSRKIYHDVWLRYNASCSGTVIFSTCSFATFDTRLAVYDGSSNPDCGDEADLYQCNDDAGCLQFRSQISVYSVSVGDPLLVRVGGYADGVDFGSVDLVISCVEPSAAVSNECSSAGTVSDGVYAIDTSSAPTSTPDVPASPTCDQIDNDVWLRYTASCSGIAVFSTCNSAQFQTVIALYNATASPCGQVGEIFACNTIASGCLASSLISGYVNDGDQFLVRIGGYGPPADGLVTLRLECLPPTPSQTITPTQSPTFPTKSPTLSPSISPTLVPSLSPSSSPSLSPSKSPTTTPSIAPSLSPSTAPSTSPSLHPSRSPSPAPTETNYIASDALCSACAPFSCSLLSHHWDGSSCLRYASDHRVCTDDVSRACFSGSVEEACSYISSPALTPITCVDPGCTNTSASALVAATCTYGTPVVTVQRVLCYEEASSAFEFPPTHGCEPGFACGVAGECVEVGAAGNCTIVVESWLSGLLATCNDPVCSRSDSCFLSTLNESVADPGDVCIVEQFQAECPSISCSTLSAGRSLSGTGKVCRRYAADINFCNETGVCAVAEDYCASNFTSNNGSVFQLGLVPYVACNSAKCVQDGKCMPGDSLLSLSEFCLRDQLSTACGPIACDVDVTAGWKALGASAATILSLAGGVFHSPALPLPQSNALVLATESLACTEWSTTAPGYCTSDTQCAGVEHCSAALDIETASDELVRCSSAACADPSRCSPGTAASANNDISSVCLTEQSSPLCPALLNCTETTRGWEGSLCARYSLNLPVGYCDASAQCITSCADIPGQSFAPLSENFNSSCISVGCVKSNNVCVPGTSIYEWIDTPLCFEDNLAHNCTSQNATCTTGGACYEQGLGVDCNSTAICDNTNHNCDTVEQVCCSESNCAGWCRSCVSGVCEYLAGSPCSVDENAPVADPCRVCSGLGQCVAVANSTCGGNSTALCSGSTVRCLSGVCIACDPAVPTPPPYAPPPTPMPLAPGACVDNDDCGGGNGDCIANSCICRAGWNPPDCSSFNCNSVSNCNANIGAGTCVGPNTCACNAGYLFPYCQPDCSALSSCHNHGVCIKPSLCRCDVGWRAPACEFPSNDGFPCTSNVECDSGLCFRETGETDGVCCRDNSDGSCGAADQCFYCHKTEFRCVANTGVQCEFGDSGDFCGLCDSQGACEAWSEDCTAGSAVCASSFHCDSGTCVACYVESPSGKHNTSVSPVDMSTSPSSADDSGTMEMLVSGEGLSDGAIVAIAIVAALCCVFCVFLAFIFLRRYLRLEEESSSSSSAEEDVILKPLKIPLANAADRIQTYAPSPRHGKRSGSYHKFAAPKNRNIRVFVEPQSIPLLPAILVASDAAQSVHVERLTKVVAATRMSRRRSDVSELDPAARTARHPSSLNSSARNSRRGSDSGASRRPSLNSQKRRASFAGLNSSGLNYIAENDKKPEYEGIPSDLRSVADDAAESLAEDIADALGMIGELSFAEGAPMNADSEPAYATVPGASEFSTVELSAYSHIPSSWSADAFEEHVGDARNNNNEKLPRSGSRSRSPMDSNLQQQRRLSNYASYVPRAGKVRSGNRSRRLSSAGNEMPLPVLPSANYGDVPGIARTARLSNVGDSKFPTVSDLYTRPKRSPSIYAELSGTRERRSNSMQYDALPPELRGEKAKAEFMLGPYTAFPAVSIPAAARSNDDGDDYWLAPAPAFVDEDYARADNVASDDYWLPPVAPALPEYESATAAELAQGARGATLMHQLYTRSTKKNAIVSALLSCNVPVFIEVRKASLSSATAEKVVDEQVPRSGLNVQRTTAFNASVALMKWPIDFLLPQGNLSSSMLKRRRRSKAGGSRLNSPRWFQSVADGGEPLIVETVLSQSSPRSPRSASRRQSSSTRSVASLRRPSSPTSPRRYRRRRSTPDNEGFSPRGYGRRRSSVRPDGDDALLIENVMSFGGARKASSGNGETMTLNRRRRKPPKARQDPGESKFRSLRLQRGPPDLKGTDMQKLRDNSLLIEDAVVDNTDADSLVVENVRADVRDASNDVTQTSVQDNSLTVENVFVDSKTLKTKKKPPKAQKDPGESDFRTLRLQRGPPDLSEYDSVTVVRAPKLPPNDVSDGEATELQAPRRQQRRDAGDSSVRPPLPSAPGDQSELQKKKRTVARGVKKKLRVKMSDAQYLKLVQLFKDLDMQGTGSISDSILLRAVKENFPATDEVSVKALIREFKEDETGTSFSSFCLVFIELWRRFPVQKTASASGGDC